MFIVYILESLTNKSTYIGYTSDLQKRLDYHNRGLNRSTRKKGPWRLVYSECYNSKTEATKRERFLKKQKNRHFYQKISGRSSDG